MLSVKTTQIGDILPCGGRNAGKIVWKTAGIFVGIEKKDRLSILSGLWGVFLSQAGQ